MLVNCSYFNIGDAPTIAGTTIQLHTAMKQDVDDAKLPTGTTSLHQKVRLFTSSTPLSITLGETEPVFDDCFILSDVPEPTIDTRHFPLRDFAHLFNETSRINLLASTTEPAFQFYTGDGIHIQGDGAHKRSFGARAGLCLEAGRPINAVNDPTARKWVILRKGETYGSYTTYTTWLSP
jgi:aldose 1-epimerase